MQVFPHTANDKGISTGQFFHRANLSEEKATRAGAIFFDQLKWLCNGNWSQRNILCCQVLSGKIKNKVKKSFQNVFLNMSTALFNKNKNSIFLSIISKYFYLDFPKSWQTPKVTSWVSVLPGQASSWPGTWGSLVSLAVYQVNRQKVTWDNFRNLPKYGFQKWHSSSFLGFNKNFIKIVCSHGSPTFREVSIFQREKQLRQLE